MKIALVDDDRECLNEMKRICHDFSIQFQCRLELTSFTSGESFLKALQKNSFSVVFMDIFMKETDGITAALKLREQDFNCLLIFMTSSMDFMPDAFSCHAFEYIVKPFTPQRISDVLNDAIKVLLPSTKYIKILSERKTMRVFFDDIASVITDAHYLNIELLNKTILRSRMTISEFLKQTQDDPRFIAVNKGIVLNADHIIDFADNCCILENGRQFPVRIKNRQKIEQAVRDYHFEKIRAGQRRAAGHN